MIILLYLYCVIRSTSSDNFNLQSVRGEAFYIVEPMAGFEPATSSLPRKCSTPELHRQYSVCFLSGRRGSNPRPSAWKADALSTELLPQNMWVEMDSNHRSDDAADLQSAPFGHSGIYPLCYVLEPLVGFEPTTPRLQITCSGQLS